LPVPLSGRVLQSLVTAFAVAACRPTPPTDAGLPAPATPTAPASTVASAIGNGCDPSFSMRLSGVDPDDIPGASASAVSATQAIARGVPCYAPGPHDDFNAASWCCQPGTRITSPGACDARFPKHLENVASLDQVPDGNGRAVSAEEALARNLACYAPGPHTAFNGSHWCCRGATR